MHTVLPVANNSQFKHQQYEPILKNCNASFISVHKVPTHQPRMFFSNLSIRFTRQKARHTRAPNTAEMASRKLPSGRPFIMSWELTFTSVPPAIAFMVALCTGHPSAFSFTTILQHLSTRTALQNQIQLWSVAHCLQIVTKVICKSCHKPVKLACNKAQEQ